MIKDYASRTELHCHTHPASPCSNFTPKEVVEHYAPLGIESLVLSNHFHRDISPFDDKTNYVNQFIDAYHETQMYAEKAGMAVILGCEARFCNESVNNDYLLYGLTEDDISFVYDYLENGTLAEFSKDFRNGTRMIIQAHPRRDGMQDIDLSLVDGIEVYNMHPGQNSRIAVAAQMAKNNPALLVTGGTDFHHEGHQGMCYMRTKNVVIDSIMLSKTLRSRDYLIEIGSTVIFPYGQEIS